MIYTPKDRRVPTMAPEAAQELARDWKGLAQSYADQGMLREAQRAESESQWWLTYSISLSQTPPAAKSA